jgi:CRP-like cAMP-binding protein
MTTPHAKALLGQPEMLQRLSADMAQHILDQLQWQKVLSAPTVTSKVCNWLIWSASGQAAWRLNTTRESISRVLQKLQADGLLSRDEEGRWKIQNPNALKGLARGEDK